jgi:hypothetical protein
MVHVTNAAGSGPCTTPCYVNCDPDWICTTVAEATCDELGGTCLKSCGGNPCNAAGGGGNQCPTTEVCCKGDGCKFRRMLRA